MREIYKSYEKEQLIKLYGLLDKVENCDAEEREKLLDEYMKDLLLQKKELEDSENEGLGGEFDPSVFEDTVLCEDDIFLLRKPEETEKEAFYEVKKAYSYIKSVINSPDYKEELWEQYISSESLNYSVLRKEDGAYLGYCGIKNIKKKIWEIAVELRKEYCHKGYGSRIVPMFLKKVSLLSGRYEFSSKVDPDNYASQGFMDKLGFQRYGISNFLFHNEEQKRKAEREFAYTLTDRHRRIAEEFGVPPEKLISHVLEYRIVV